MAVAERESGFVLAATIWILAAITLGVGFFSSWTNLSLQRVQRSKSEVQGEIDQSSTEALVLYFMATHSVDTTGFSLAGKGSEILHLRLDDRIYKGVGRGRFALQDESGLLKLSDLVRFPYFLEYMGVPAKKVGPLVSQFTDYTDADDEKLLNGAEAAEYKERGLPPPPNRALFTSWESSNILDWGTTDALWKGHSFPRMTTVIDIGGLPNLNTAPGPVLKLVTGMTDDEVKLVLREREKRVFNDVVEIYALLGRQLDIMEMEISFWASNYFRLSVWFEGSNRMREIHFKLAPKDTENETPWKISYMISTPLAEDQRNAQYTVIPNALFTKKYY